MTVPSQGDRAPFRRPQDCLPVSPAPPLNRAFSVRVEFDRRVSDGDFLVDMSSNPSHDLFDFFPQISTNDAGCAEIELTVPGGDVWASILTAMTVIRQSGYEPAAVHVTPRDDIQEGGLAA